LGIAGSWCPYPRRHRTPAAIRTLLRIIDGLLTYAVAFFVVLASGRRQRLGDMAAHTFVRRM
jgi:uncharacterized RDD family membrane protein YckC